LIRKAQVYLIFVETAIADITILCAVSILGFEEGVQGWNPWLGALPPHPHKSSAYGHAKYSFKGYPLKARPIRRDPKEHTFEFRFVGMVVLGIKNSRRI
jgi:hypothetical protein